MLFPGNADETLFLVFNNYIYYLKMEMNVQYKEQFSNDCWKSSAKVTTATNHNRSKQRDKPIKIPSNYQ